MANENHMFHSKWQKKCVLWVVMWCSLSIPKPTEDLRCKYGFLKYGKYLEPKQFKNKVRLALCTHWFCIHLFNPRFRGCRLNLVNAEPAPVEDILWSHLSLHLLGYLSKVLEPVSSDTEDPFIQHHQAF